MSWPENFYGPYCVPAHNIGPGLEGWLREHAGHLNWHVHMITDSQGLEFYFRDAEVGTLFALTWS